MCYGIQGEMTDVFKLYNGGFLMERFGVVLNPLVAPVCILLLILLDYKKDGHTDTRQRGIFLNINLLALFGVFCSFVWRMVQGHGGLWAGATMYLFATAANWLQIAALTRCLLLFDYIVWKNGRRLAKVKKLCDIILLVYLLVLVVNFLYGNSIYNGFYYYVSSGNVFMRGNLYFIRFVFTLAPIATAFVELLLARHRLPGRLAACLVCFVSPAALGAVVDWLLYSNVLWSCLAVQQLFVYLFILRQDADRDALTNLYNRRKLKEILAAIETETRTEAYAFIMLDLDGFKGINDKYGHAEGDRVLQGVASVVQNSVRRVDYVVRYGGDEMLIIAKKLLCPEDIVRRLYHNLAQYNLAKQGPPLSFSVGYDVYAPDDPRTPQEFLEVVDSLMYRDKARRKSKASWMQALAGNQSKAT